MPPDNQTSDYRHDCEYGLVVKGEGLWLRGYPWCGDHFSSIIYLDQEHGSRKLCKVNLALLHLQMEDKNPFDLHWEKS